MYRKMTDKLLANCSSLFPTQEKEMSKMEVISSETVATYEKCILCPDHGKHCKGPKLSALQTIENVRCYHRRLRDARKIPMKSIFAFTEKEIINIGSNPSCDYMPFTADYTLNPFNHDDKLTFTFDAYSQVEKTYQIGVWYFDNDLHYLSHNTTYFTNFLPITLPPSTNTSTPAK